MNSSCNNGNNHTPLLKNDNKRSFEDHWPSMRPVILKLLRQDPVTRSEWQDIFWAIHTVCLWDDKGPQKLHQALKDDIMDFIKQAQIKVLTNHEDQALLKSYISAWKKFFIQCSYLPMPFGQLETSLGSSSGNRGSNVNKKPGSEESIVRKLMLDSWNQSIFNTIKHRLQSCAMKLVASERNGEAFDSQLVIGVRESYVNLCSNSNDRLQIYRDNFEKAYIESTEQFYKSKAPEYLDCNGVLSYMIWADAKLREEEVRGSKYLESYAGSLQALSDCCVSVLVTRFKDILLAETPELIKNNQTDRLNLMFRLMDRVPDGGGINPMLKDLESHILSQGLADMIANAEAITQDSEKYIEQLLELFQRFSKLVHDAFNDDPRFLTSRDKAFKSVVNDTSVFKLELSVKPKPLILSSPSIQPLLQGNANQTTKLSPESRCPELLANYCDMLLRKTPLSRKLTSDEIESKLREVLLVLKYVQNKDVFMRYHKAHLTRRLILDTSADNEKEENMVEWLREVGMPADFVNKLARMFQDIKVSEDLNQLFKSAHKLNALTSGDNKQTSNTIMAPNSYTGTLPPGVTVCSSGELMCTEGSVCGDATCVATPPTQGVSIPTHAQNPLSIYASDKLSPNPISDSGSSPASNLSDFDYKPRPIPDYINIKILNAGAWARGSERVQVTLPLELEDIIPEVEEFYKKKHSGRKLRWYHHMSNGTICFANEVGRYDLDVTTFQIAALFCWNERPYDKISFENLRLATELPDAELRRTLWSLVAFPKLRKQVLLAEPEAKQPKDFTDQTLFYVNQQFEIIKNGKGQKRGKLNLIGRLQLSTEKTREEENEGIVQLRVLRTQEAIVKIMKKRKKITNAQLITELVEILKNMFLPSKKMIKEQIEWLIEQKYMKRDDNDISIFIYLA